jgi:hypothetical protein
LAGALSFDEKIRQSVALFWFRLRNDGILHLRAEIQRTIDISPAFLEHARFGKKDCGLRTCKPRTEQSGGLEAFLHEVAQNFEVFSKI